MTGLIGVERQDAVAIVTFNNPPRGYIDMAQVGELDRAIQALADDTAVRAIVFTGGVPGVFIRHFDVREIFVMADEARATGLDADGLMRRAMDQAKLPGILEKIDALPKPTLAAINGFCQGGGFEFALCCDLRIAEPGDYRIGLPEVNIGIVPGGGGAERLPRLIGEARSLEMILRGRTVGPDEALRLGLVHEVAPDVLGRALELARELAAKSPAALALAKSLVKRTTDVPLSQALGRMRGAFQVLITSDPEAERLMRNFLADDEDINRSDWGCEEGQTLA